MAPFKRIPGWRAALYAEIARHKAEPFCYGERDCALFLANCILAMTGVDPAAAYRGRYTTLDDGIALLRADGHDDHIALAAALLPTIHVSRAHVGDGAVVPADADGFALGVVTGAEIAVAHPRGLGFVPLTAAIRAFRIG